MFNKIFSITIILLAATLAQPALATSCDNGKCGVVVFENTTWTSINGVIVYDTVTGQAVAGAPIVPPKATIRVYFNDKTRNPLRFMACQIFAGIPLGCIGIGAGTSAGANSNPSISCPYPQYKMAKIILNDDIPYLICK